MALMLLPTHPRHVEFDLSHFKGVQHVSQPMVFQKHLPRYHGNDYLVISQSGVMAFIKASIPVEGKKKKKELFYGTNYIFRARNVSVAEGCLCSLSSQHTRDCSVQTCKADVHIHVHKD